MEGFLERVLADAFIVVQYDRIEGDQPGLGFE